MLQISTYSDVFISENVTSSCRLTASGWTFTWQQDEKQMSQNVEFSFPNDGSIIEINVNSKDLARSYDCKGEDKGKGCNNK